MSEPKVDKFWKKKKNRKKVEMCRKWKSLVYKHAAIWLKIWQFWCAAIVTVCRPWAAPRTDVLEIPLGHMKRSIWCVAICCLSRSDNQSFSLTLSTRALQPRGLARRELKSSWSLKEKERKKKKNPDAQDWHELKQQLKLLRPSTLFLTRLVGDAGAHVS